MRTLTETDGIIVKIFTEDYDLSAMFKVFVTRVFLGKMVVPVFVCGFFFGGGGVVNP